MNEGMAPNSGTGVGHGCFCTCQDHVWFPMIYGELVSVASKLLSLNSLVVMDVENGAQGEWSFKQYDPS